MLRMVSIGLAAILVTACSASVYKQETSAVGTSANDLGKVLSGYGAAISATQSESAAARRMREFYLGAPVNYGMTCWQEAHAAYNGFLSAARTAGSQITPDEQTAIDEAFAKFRDVKPCAVVSVEEPSEEGPSGPSPVPAAPQEGTPSEQEAARLAEIRRRKIVRLEQAVAAAIQAAERPPVGSMPAREGPARMPDFARELEAYGNALTAIAEAKSTEDVQKAVTEAGEGLSGLLTAANQPNLADPLAELATSIAGMAIEEAQRLALRQAVLLFEGAWPDIAPALTQAARIEHGALVWEQAHLSWTTAHTAQYYVNQPALLDRPFDRLQVHESLNGRVVSAGAALRTSTRTDPGAAIRAFTTTHNDLALAVTDDGRLAASFLASLRALNDKINALDEALDKREATGGSET